MNYIRELEIERQRNRSTFSSPSLCELDPGSLSQTLLLRFLPNRRNHTKQWAARPESSIFKQTAIEHK